MVKKIFGLEWLFEPLEEEPGFLKKVMFGGLAAYLDGRLILVITEKPGHREYRGQKFTYDIWNGILVPVEREHHDSIVKEFPDLAPHPVLRKWLYLPLKNRKFEETAREIMDRIVLRDPQFGVCPKEKRKTRGRA